MKVAAHVSGELGADDACALFAAMLAGDVADPELAAILAAWQQRRATLAETSGFLRALDAHTGRLEVSREGPRPIVLAASRGIHGQVRI